MMAGLVGFAGLGRCRISCGIDFLLGSPKISILRNKNLKNHKKVTNLFLLFYTKKKFANQLVILVQMTKKVVEMVKEVLEMFQRAQVKVLETKEKLLMLFIKTQIILILLPLFRKDHRVLFQKDLPSQVARKFISKLSNISYQRQIIYTLTPKQSLLLQRPPLLQHLFLN